MFTTGKSGLAAEIGNVVKNKEVIDLLSEKRPTASASATDSAASSIIELKINK